MRVLGLDFGQRRIGAAISDGLGITAQPLGVIERSRHAVDIEAVCRLIKAHAVTTVVIGLPLSLKGERARQAQRALSFGRALKDSADVSVKWVDERFTTAQAARAMQQSGKTSRRQKDMIDQVAAQLILQSYLDAKHAR